MEGIGCLSGLAMASMWRINLIVKVAEFFANSPMAAVLPSGSRNQIQAQLIFRIHGLRTVVRYS
jgi:hypothetical protein